MADPGSRPDIADRLRVLRESYARQLKDKFGEMIQLAERLRAGVVEEDIRNLYLWLHTQAGSAGTFGFPALGSASRALEIELKQHMENQQWDDAWRKEFARRTLSLESLLDFSIPSVAPTNTEVVQTKTEVVSVHTDVMSTNAEVAAPTSAAPVAKPLVREQGTPRLHLSPPSIWVLSTDLREAEHLMTVLGEFGFLVQHFQALAQVDCALECEMPLIMIIDLDNPGDLATDTTSLEALAAWRRRCPEQLQLLFMSQQQDFETLMGITQLRAGGFLTKPCEVPRLMDTIDKLLPMEREKAFRVLLIDDDQLLSHYYQGALEAAGFVVCVLDAPNGVLDAMSNFRPDVVLLDLNLPGCSGDQVARMLRLHNGWPEVPVIYFSAEQDPDRQIEAQQLAGDDFLTKPVAARQLVSAMTVRARRSRLLTRILSTDSLTSLLKHAAIKDRLEQEVRRTERSGAPLSVAMVDIDKFKYINDTWGHATGDRVIKALSHLLRNRLRGSDILGRYGGDEFMVIFPDSNSTDVLGVLSEVADRFRRIEFSSRGESFYCTLSVGVADNQQCHHADQLIEAADRALLEVKKVGRNAVKMAGGNMIRAGSPGGRQRN